MDYVVQEMQPLRQRSHFLMFCRVGEARGSQGSAKVLDIRTSLTFVTSL